MYQPGALATKVICLTQVVSEDELKDDDEYEDIMEDMRQEGGKFGENLATYVYLKFLHCFWLTGIVCSCSESLSFIFLLQPFLHLYAA